MLMMVLQQKRKVEELPQKPLPKSKCTMKLKCPPRVDVDVDVDVDEVEEDLVAMAAVEEEEEAAVVVARKDRTNKIICQTRNRMVTTSYAMLLYKML